VLIYSNVNSNATIKLDFYRTVLVAVIIIINAMTKAYNKMT